MAKLRPLLVGLAALLTASGTGCGNATDTSPNDAVHATSGGDIPQYEGSFTVLESPSHGPELCASVHASSPPKCGGLPIRNWDWDDVDGERSANGTTWGAWHVIGSYDDGALTLTSPPTAPRAWKRPADGPSAACDDPEVVDPRAGEAQWQAAVEAGTQHEVDELVTMWASGYGPSEEFVVHVVVRPGAGDAASNAVRRRYAGRLCVVERDLPLESELASVQSAVQDDQEARARLRWHIAASEPMRGAVVLEVWIVDDAATAYARNRWGPRVILEPLLLPVDQEVRE